MNSKAPFPAVLILLNRNKTHLTQSKAKVASLLWFGTRTHRDSSLPHLFGETGGRTGGTRAKPGLFCTSLQHNAAQAQALADTPPPFPFGRVCPCTIRERQYSVHRLVWVQASSLTGTIPAFPGAVFIGVPSVALCRPCVAAPQGPSELSLG